MDQLKFGDNAQAAKLCVCQVASTHPTIIRDAFGDEWHGIVDDFGDLICVWIN